MHVDRIDEVSNGTKVEKPNWIPDTIRKSLHCRVRSFRIQSSRGHHSL